MNIYFDNAASTPLRKEVLQSMQEVLKHTFGNPSSTHYFGVEAKSYLEKARYHIAQLFHAQAQEIIFTSGATESNNALLDAAVNYLNVCTFITSPIEHAAVLNPIEKLAANKNISVKYVKLTASGHIDFEDLAEQLAKAKKPTMVSLMAINNELGTKACLTAIGDLCVKHQALFHTDAAQFIGKYAIDLRKIPIDFLSASAHKFHGPKGVGFSFIKFKHKIGPFIFGGGQEGGLRSGSEAVHNIVGMHKALQIAYENLATDTAKVSKLKSYFVAKIKDVFPEVIFNGNSDELDQNSYAITNISLPTYFSESKILTMQLNLKGVACANGSACQSGGGMDSHVLQALGIATRQRQRALRFSFSVFNTTQEIDYLIETLSTCMVQRGEKQLSHGKMN